jgi:hypothetical protein
MHSIARAVRKGSLTGERIRLPFPRLNRAVDLRTKELLVVGGAPGSGKSTLAVALAVKKPSDVSMLYVVQDSPGSVLARIASNYLHTPTYQTHKLLKDQDPGILNRLTALDPASLMLTSGAHSVELITEKLEAYIEWAGRAPHVVVIDNLVDMVSDRGTAAENVFYADVLLRLKQLAIKHDCLFMVLHHVTRAGRDGDHDMGRQPIRMKDLLFAGEREARHVWGVFNNGKNVINVQILKQQDGQADPTGSIRIPFSWDPTYSAMVELGAVHGT